MPRASVALPDGFHGARPARRAVAPRVMPGQVPLDYVEPRYHPTKGAWFANRLIQRHPQAMIRARKLAAEWLLFADPRTAPGFVFMADFWGALNDHITAHGEMAIYQRHNHI